MEGGEFRRINIVYFLSRNGVVEQPHLVCVHHLYARGVRLCDVKRWLSELRGTNVSDSFAWSYKRRYKNEYVWRDLMDNDLLTPFTDNEYVLKGSMLFRSPPPSILQSHNYSSLASTCQVASKEEKPTAQKPETIQIPKGRYEEVQVELKGKGESPKPSPRTDDESSDLHTAIFKVEEEEEEEEKKKKDDDRFRQRRHRQPSGCTDVFRALLGCRGSETAELALVRIGRDRSGTHKSRGGPGRPSHLWPDDYGNSGCYSNFRRESRGSSGRKCGGEEKKMSSMAKYKLEGLPNCSQCGKQFNPEKLHSHMRSCKAVKRGRSAFNKTPIGMDSNS